MEISAKRFEELVTANAYLTIVVGLHSRGNDYIVRDVLDIVKMSAAEEDREWLLPEIKIDGEEIKSGTIAS
jgi:hypothetical protein